MKNLAILFSLMLFVSFSRAQTGSIQGKISDRTTRQQLSLATVTVFVARDTAIVTYRMSNEDGSFKIPNLPLNESLRFLVTYSGYEAFRQDFTLTAANPVLNFDSIGMVSTTKELEEVIVTAERPPVMIKKDTIEFNANAFKTLPNALVEDLLKKLPGVRVDADGNITVNGKPVNKILVDGKTFFGDDPKMASRNLPANAIDKVQVVDDKEQAMLNGDNNTSNVGKVVNITLKKGFKKGAFGKVYAGGGTKDRYEAGGIANIFRDTLQVSVLAYSNNLNRPGFSYSELMNAGGLQRSNSNRNSNSMSMWSSDRGSSIMINGVNFGGSNNYGLSQSNGGGFNLNHAPDKKKSFYLQYYFGDVINKRKVNTDVQQFNGDTVVHNITALDGTTKNYGHNFGAGMKLKPDSVTTINFNASYTIGLQRDNLLNNITSDNNYLGALSYGNVLQMNKLNNYNYSHSFYFIKQSRQNKQRTITITNQLNTGNNNSDYRTDSKLSYFYPTAYDSLQYQLRQVRLPQTQVTSSIVFKEPLSKRFTLRMNNRYRYNYVSNRTNTLYANTPDGGYTLPYLAGSGSFRRDYSELYFAQRLVYQYNGLSISPAVEEFLLFSTVHSTTLENPAQQNIRKLRPAIDIDYKNLSFSYEKDNTLPSYTYLIPVTDNSNPYYIANGNTGLQAAKANSFNLNYNFNDPKSNLNIWLYATGSFTDNDVVQKTVVDNQGVQTTTPVNADGTSSYYLNFNIDKDFKFGKNNTLKLSGGGSYSIDRSRMLYNSDSSWQTTFQLYNWVGFHLNINDVFEWDNSYNPGFNFTRYTNPQFGNLNVTTQNLVSGVVVRWPKHIIWEHNFDYTYNSSLSTGAAKNLLRWTAAINFTFLKDDRGVLKISAYDILNQNKNLIRIIASRNQLSYNRGNILPQYLMATFTYNIRSAGGKKQKVGGQSLFSF